jgi:hypothetical protein
MKLYETQGRPVMVIPSMDDLANSADRAEKIKSLCAACAKQLAKHYYVWRKGNPLFGVLKTWEGDRFLGVDLTMLITYIVNTYDTYDGEEHFLGPCRAVAALIWEAATAADSPLPTASWTIELQMKKATAK